MVRRHLAIGVEGASIRLRAKRAFASVRSRAHDYSLIDRNARLNFIYHEEERHVIPSSPLLLLLATGAHVGRLAASRGKAAEIPRCGRVYLAGRTARGRRGTLAGEPAYGAHLAAVAFT